MVVLPGIEFMPTYVRLERVFTYAISKDFLGAQSWCVVWKRHAEQEQSWPKYLPWIWQWIGNAADILF